MTRIYTRKGDDGTTTLWYGGRVAKTDARTEAYGSVDEAGAALGVVRSLCGPEEAELAADLLRLQRELFVAGAELATSPESKERLEDGWEIHLRGRSVVCVLTGSGLKDPDRAMALAPGVTQVAPSLSAVEAALAW